MAGLSTGVRSSKRQRVEVKYCESETSHHGDESCDDSDVPPQAKKRKTKSFKKSLLKQKEKAFPFQLLPAELRNKIYRLALTVCITVLIKCKQTSSGKKAYRVLCDDKLRHPMNTMILRLNKQIFSEAQPFLYAYNVFFFHDTMGLFNFLAGIGTRNVSQLTHLVFRSFGPSGRIQRAMDNPTMTLLASAVNLSVLDITGPIKQWFYKTDPQTMDGWSLTLRKNAKDFYKIAHYWLRARGEAALGAIVISDIFTSDFADIHDQSKLGTKQVFKDELRSLMKR